MPRTKAPRAKKENDVFDLPLARAESDYKDVKAQLSKLENEIISRIIQHGKERNLSLTQEGNMTVGEYQTHNQSSWQNGTTFVSASVQNILSEIKSTSKKNISTRLGLKRSASCQEDEGYLTAESSNGATSGQRQSRTRQRQGRTTKRQSKSAANISRAVSNTSSRVREVGRSESNASKFGSVLGKFKTPFNNHHHPPNSYGIVTPKVAPNTPQVLLRRPKMGEVAFSLQGSPLFTGGVVSETIANVNIPLEDGNLLSIQPQRGLRLSQVPKLDPETTRQLQMLRDNLNKVCAAGMKR